MTELPVAEPSKAPHSSPDALFTLWEVAASIWRRKRQVFLLAAASTLLAIGMSYCLPKVYTSEASLLPVTPSNDMGGAFASNLVAQLGPAAGLLGGFGGNRGAELVEILGSRSMAERVIERCQLEKSLKGWNTRNQLVLKVRQMVVITPPTLKNKVVGLRVNAPEAELSARIANAYVDELKGMLDEIGYNSASRNRKFVDRQLSKAKSDLAETEERLTQYQVKNPAVPLPDTVVSSIQTISELEAQRINAEVQLSSANASFGTMASKVGALQSDPLALVELDVKRKALASQQKALARAQSDYLNKLSSLPPKALTLARLQRDVQVQNAIYLALAQQHETAVINENRESESFIALDRAVAPDRPSKPKKPLIALMGLVLGLMAGAIWAGMREWPLVRSEPYVNGGRA